MSLLFNPQKSHRHLHRGLRQRSRGKDTKSLGIKTHLGEKTAKKLQISEKVFIFEMEFRRYFHSKLKINRDLFCSLLVYSYLCNVKGTYLCLPRLVRQATK